MRNGMPDGMPDRMAKYQAEGQKIPEIKCQNGLQHENTCQIEYKMYER